MALKSFFVRVKQAISEFLSDDALTLAAALAFYTALSLSPLLLILLWGASLLGNDKEQALINHLVELIGPQAGEVIQTVVKYAKEEPSLANIAGIVSLITLLLSASGVFGQLQHSLNLIWDVNESERSGFFHWIKRRLLSAGMVFTFGFLMIVSLTASAILSGFVGTLDEAIPLSPAFWRLLHEGVATLVFAILFAVLFRFLPDRRVEWHEVWFGAIVTAVLFTLGKFGIGIYLGQSSVGSAFGAAGSLIVLLVWVYYSAVIFFFGAEIAQVWRKPEGRAG